jgi:hypothetical protein
MNHRIQRRVLVDTETPSSAGLCVLQNSVLKLWLVARTAWFMALMRVQCWRSKLPMNLQEHPTSNAEHRENARSLAPFGVRCWMLDVGCFPLVQGFKARELVSGNSLLGGVGGGCRTKSYPITFVNSAGLLRGAAFQKVGQRNTEEPVGCSQVFRKEMDDAVRNGHGFLR